MSETRPSDERSLLDSTAGSSSANEAEEGPANDSSKEEVGTSANNITQKTCCSKCGKRSVSYACTQSACLQCCEDPECQKHVQAKEKQQWKELVLAGKTAIQMRAREKRQSRLPVGRFREPGFLYSGDTIVIWDLKSFGRNQQWKEEAIRRSRRRKAREMDDFVGTNNDTHQKYPPLRNSRKRFHQIVEEHFKRS